MSTELRAEKFSVTKILHLVIMMKIEKKTEIDGDNEPGTRRRKEAQDAITTVFSKGSSCILNIG